MSAAAPDRPSLVPDWIVAVATLVGGIWVMFMLAYALGAGGMRVAGSSISFDREYDRTFYRVTDDIVFSVSDTWVSLIRVKSGVFPFNPVCGRYLSNGTVIGNPSFVAGNIVLTRDLWENSEAAGIDIETGELLDPAALAERGLWSASPADLPGAAGAGGKPDDTPPAAPTPPPGGGKPDRDAAPPTPAAAGAPPAAVPAFEAGVPLTAEWVAENFDKARAINESCMMFNAAFLAIYLLLALIAIPTAVIRGFKRRAAARAPS